ncbi:MAG: GrpB family protein [Acidobacteriota bacterium]|nr:GrpB family protein [Acidobacteriota bacterium]
MKVSIVEYRPEWRKMFETEKGILQTTLGEVPARIEHIGSTAVAGLAAKPIIDLMIGLEDFSIADQVVPKIEASGRLAYKIRQRLNIVSSRHATIHDDVDALEFIGKPFIGLTYKDSLLALVLEKGYIPPHLT